MPTNVHHKQTDVSGTHRPHVRGKLTHIDRQTYNDVKHRMSNVLGIRPAVKHTVAAHVCMHIVANTPKLFRGPRAKRPSDAPPLNGFGAPGPCGPAMPHGLVSMFSKVIERKLIGVRVASLCLVSYTSARHMIKSAYTYK